MAGFKRKKGGKAGFENPYCGPSLRWTTFPCQIGRKFWMNGLRPIDHQHSCCDVTCKPAINCTSPIPTNTLSIQSKQPPPNFLPRHRRPKLITWTRTCSCLRAVVCYKQLFTAEACMGCKRSFLKERKNVLFLNKILEKPFTSHTSLCK